jgi:uncharacterized protein (DUF488 family)
MENIDLFTIGFTKKTAEKFFNLLKDTSAKRLIDVRLNNISQLAGFAKSKDLAFFLGELCEMDYLHMPELAPTKDILDDYKKNGGDWAIYEDKFLNLMDNRSIDKSLDQNLIHESCFLCSEDKPHFCHRRLLAEYLNEKWDTNISVEHLT